MLTSLIQFLHDKRLRFPIWLVAIFVGIILTYSQQAMGQELAPSNTQTQEVIQPAESGSKENPKEESSDVAPTSAKDLSNQELKDFLLEEKTKQDQQTEIEKAEVQKKENTEAKDTESKDKKEKNKTEDSRAAKEGEDWREPTTDDPRFDIFIAADHREIQDMLRAHLELHRYRAVPDLTSLELRELLEHTEGNIRSLTGTLGYFSPIITMTVMPAKDRPDETELPLVLIYVMAGEITTVTEMGLNYEGEIEEKKDDVLLASQRRRLRWAWAIKAGDPFTQDAWGAAKSNMKTRLTTQYFPAGKISASKATINPKDNTAKLSVTLDSGPRFYLGDYNIVGIKRYNERVIRNFARLKKGDDFLLDDITKAQQRLTESGYYDTAYVFILPDSPNPKEAPINVFAVESYIHNMTIGPGFSTDNGPRLSFNYKNNQVPLLGWQLKSSFKIDKDNQLVDATLAAIPDDDYWRWTAYVKLENESDKNNEDNKSLQARYGRSFISDEVDTAHYLQFDSAKTKNLITKEEIDVQAVSAHTAWTWRNFNNLKMPRSGWGLSLEFGAGTTVGKTSTPFVRTKLRAQKYLPLKSWKSGRFIVRGEFGGLFAKEGEPMPSTLLFRTGGDSTVRGYAHRYIALDQLDNISSSGRYMTVGSIEYQRPIFSKGRPTAFDWATFVDTGSVSNKISDVDLHTGVGVGVRWRSPVGPINADLAYGIKTSQLRIHFNIGFNF